MKNIHEYIRSVRFAFGRALKFVPGETYAKTFVVIIAGSLSYASAYLLGKIVNLIVEGTKSGSYVGIWYVLGLYIAVSALPAILNNFRSYLTRRGYFTFSMELEMEVLKKREKIDIATYEDPKFQDLIQRSFRNGFGPIIQLAHGQYDTIQALTSLIVGTILSIHFNALVYFVVVIFAIPSFIADMKYAGNSWTLWAKDSPEQRRMQDLRQHITYKTYLIETKLLQSGKKIISWIQKIISDFAQKQLNIEKSRLWQSSLADLLALVGFAIGLFLILRDVIAGHTQVGSLVFMLSALSTVRNSISNLLQSVSAQYENHLIIRDIIKIMETEPAVIESLTPTSLNLTAAPEIVFENVSFKYPGGEKWSLRNVSLTMSPGKKIGLVGNNGAGKTTFVKLLCRIYDPTEGRILVNGVDLKDIATHEWWSYLGIMFQDYASYDFIVQDAIGIGQPNKEVRLDKVVEAAHVSQAHTFIEEWKESYNHQLGVEFGGAEPSKGQRQKLSIAKIIYRNALVMILDEPTASVDAESEAKIFDSLENLSKNTTALLISHDFSTILQCDHIFVLENAKLIEEGSHKELISKKGVYAGLYNLQAERFKK